MSNMKSNAQSIDFPLYTYLVNLSELIIEAQQMYAIIVAAMGWSPQGNWAQFPLSSKLR
jgi:hypothetical protein